MKCSLACGKEFVMRTKYKTSSKKPSFVRYLVFVMFRIQRTEALFALLNLFAILFGLGGIYATSKYSSVQLLKLSPAAILLFALSFVSVTLSLLSVLVGVYRNHVKDHDTDLKRNNAIPLFEVALNQIHPEESDRRAGYATSLVRLGNGIEEPVFRSEMLDEYLWDNDVVIKEDKQKRIKLLRGIRSRCNSAAEALHSRFIVSRKAKKQFNNDSKLCLADDLRPKTEMVRCYKGGYYISFLTNELCTNVLIRNDEHQTVLFDGRSLFPVVMRSDKSPVLLPLSQSEMCNHIGISTIGFSKDRKLVLWQQTAKAQQSENQIAPTGSGSCDWKDLAPSRRLKETLKIAMERELTEESSRRGSKVKQNLVEKTIVIGFFRWVRRGGKPEFLGISRLRVNAGDLDPNISEVTQPTHLPLSFPMSSIDDLGDIIEQIKVNGNLILSVPLVANLECIQHYLAKRKDSLGKFLFA
jgi:hypothetical protein